MADLSFRPDPEPHPATVNPARPPAPAWVAGLKNGLLTALRYLCLAVLLIILVVGLVGLSHGVHQANWRLDRIEKKLDELEKKIDDTKPDDTKVMPPAN